MCRFLAYLGEPILLEELVCTPRHSLVRQSLRSEEAKVVTNGDGFGVGWYGEQASPGVYREVMPAWSDENLLSLCAHVRSPLFFAHVRAATGGGIARHNCHPFTVQRHLFMHNGQIGGYAQLRRRLESGIEDALYMQRKGATDSELLFLLVLGLIAQGRSPAEATAEVLRAVRELMQAQGITQPLRFAAALADGEQVWAFRYASDGHAPTLYLNEQPGGGVIASEPLEGNPEGWQLLAEGSAVQLSRRGALLLPLPV